MIFRLPGACGLIRTWCHRGSGGSGNRVSGQAYFLALPRLESACVALSGTRAQVFVNKLGEIGILVACVLSVAGCGSPSRVVVLQQPDTKQTVECRVDPLGSFDSTGQIESCVFAYNRAGYKVVGDSK